MDDSLLSQLIVPLDDRHDRRSFACTLLGRLAVDREYRAMGPGKQLLVDALRRASIHSSEVASWAVVVDAKDEAAERFYAKHGFIALPRTHARLFLPMLTIAELFR